MLQLHPSWTEKLKRSGYFFFALLFHLIIFLMVATVVIFKAPELKQDAEFKVVHIAVPPPPPAPIPPPAGDAANSDLAPQPVLIPPSSPQQVVSIAQNASFQIDTSKLTDQAISHLSVAPPKSTGMTEGAGETGKGLGTSAGIDFFGVHSDGKRIAFLLDFSGSMGGDFRKLMERQLGASLRQLPEGTQVILICWAGPAWLYNQTEPEIAKKWKKIGDYDNFALLPDQELAPPVWVDITSSAIARILRDIKGQVSASGGTDWRQPFIYAMKADPPPDVIFFLTDGQMPPANKDRALKAIDSALKKADTVPKVNCLWIENKAYKSDTLEELSKTYQGEFQKVSATAAVH